MSTEIPLQEGDAVRRAVEDIIASPVLKSSASLCKLLRHLVQQSIDEPETPHKEYQIATEVFGRAADFDPRLDSVVRVQCGRLRSKLAEYYAGPGSKDDVILTLPKGSYALSVHHRNSPAVASQEATAPTPHEAEHPSTGDRTAISSPRLGRKGTITLAFLAGVLAATAVLIFISYHREISALRNLVPPVAAPLQTFWSPFVRARQGPLVVFTNSVFVGTADTGMRYFDSSRDSRDLVTEQHYTGVGEVVGVLELDRVFNQFQRAFRIKRAGLFTLDEARDNNLIFAGSPVENVRLGEILNLREFVFRRMPGGPNGCDYAVVDLHPEPGKSDKFFSTPRTHPMEVDYAIIALMRGLDRNLWTLMLAGTSTIGTQAAIESVSQKDFLEELLGRLKIPSGGEMKPFEALLRVKVANDVPLQTELVTARRTE